MSRKGMGKKFKFGGVHRKIGTRYLKKGMTFLDLYFRAKSGADLSDAARVINGDDVVEGVEYRTSPTTKRKRPIKPKRRKATT